MRLLTLPIFLIVTLGASGCSDHSGKTSSSINNQGSAIRSIIPEFAGACSYGSGQQWYRIASDPSTGRIYFASIKDRLNINAAQVSGPVLATEDTYEFEFFEINGESRKSTFYRKNATLVITNPPETQRFAGIQQTYGCDRLPDEEYQRTLELLKAGREIGESELRQSREAYQNRPNKM